MYGFPQVGLPYILQAVCTFVSTSYGCGGIGKATVGMSTLKTS